MNLPERRGKTTLLALVALALVTTVVAGEQETDGVEEAPLTLEARHFCTLLSELILSVIKSSFKRAQICLQLVQGHVLVQKLLLEGTYSPVAGVQLSFHCRKDRVPLRKLFLDLGQSSLPTHLYIGKPMLPPLPSKPPADEQTNESGS